MINDNSLEADESRPPAVANTRPWSCCRKFFEVDGVGRKTDSHVETGKGLSEVLSVWRSQPKAAAKRVGHAPQVSQRQGIETAKIDEGPLEGHACSITGTQDGKWRQCSFKNSILSILATPDDRNN